MTGVQTCALPISDEHWDLILCDHNLPGFSAQAALRLLQDLALDLPFIIVSGVMQEDEAIAAMRAGAHDYLSKNKLERLIPAVERELREASNRREKRLAEQTLRQSEARLRALTDNIPGVVFQMSYTPEGMLGFQYLSEAAAMLVRAAYGGNVLVEAWGYRALKDDGTDATARQTFSTRLASYNPSKIWFAIGTNDYGNSNGMWSAADFGTAYADLLDKLHTDIPGATIYCQSPLIRTTETANLNHSNTLDDYRAQISTAAAARSGYCTYVNGKTILSTSDLTDGVHPSTAGHLLWANAIKSAMEV